VNVNTENRTDNFLGDLIEMQIGRFPRVKLANLPTPLEYMPNLTRSLGGPRIYVKRDDLTGLATGGNKTRKLEFLLGEAVEQGADVIVTGANMQSNHMRQTAAAARRLGLDVVLVVSGERPDEVNGNLLLDTLLGADIRFVGGHEDDLDPKLDAVAEELSDAGRQPYVIKKFGSVPVGTIGYANAFLELVNQLNERNLAIDHIVVAGKGGTYAGLYLAARAMNSDIDIAAVAISELLPNWRGEVCDLIKRGGALLGVELDVKPDELHVLTEYFGEEYGAPTEGMVEAVKLTARTEGILLDPIYTGKAMAGLIDQVRKGAFRKEDNVLFWHTGGIPTLFTPQYRDLFL